MTPFSIQYRKTSVRPKSNFSKKKLSQKAGYLSLFFGPSL